MKLIELTPTLQSLTYVYNLSRQPLRDPLHADLADCDIGRTTKHLSTSPTFGPYHYIFHTLSPRETSNFSTLR